MIVEKKSQGILIYESTQGDYLFKKMYIGYSLKKAKAEFKRELKEENRKIIKGE
jgi:hypothetical protein